MKANQRPSRGLAILVVLLMAAPLGAATVAAGPSPTSLQPLSHAEYPLGSWKMFHANPEHTGEGDTTLPPAGHVVWRMAGNASDKPEGGAAVDNGVVFVGMGSTMTAVNATDGRRLWQHGMSGRIFSTPALWNGMLFSGAEGSFGSPNFEALHASNGTEIWNASEPPGLGGGIHFVHSSPTVANGLVYYGSFTYWLYARHALNGTLAWSADLTSEVIGSPAESNGILYAVSAGIHNLLTPSWDVAPRLWAFNSTSGTPLWNQTITEGQLLASPVVAGGVVYAATAGFSYIPADVDSGFVLAFDALSGAPLWTSPDVGRMVATPAVFGSVMYVAGAGEQAGGPTATSARLRWLDLTASGAVSHEEPVGSNASMESSPAAVSGRVVTAARDGTVAVFLASFFRLWSFNLGADIIAPPAVADERIFIPALDGFLYAFGTQPDFAVAPAGIALSDTTPHSGQPLKLRVTVENLGDKKGSGSVSAQANRSGVVTPLATWALTDLDKFSQVTVESPLRFSLEGNTALEVSISNVTPLDGDGGNDAASVVYAVLPTLSGWVSRYGDARGSNFLETDSPQNSILLWEQRAFDVSGGGFVAYGDTLVFAESSANKVVAVPRGRGNETPSWTWSAPAAIIGSPVLANGLLAVATAAPLDPAGNLTFIDPDTGLGVRTVALAQRPTASAVPYGDFLLLPTSDRLVEISLANLSIERALPTVDVPPPAQPALRSEPAVVGGWAFAISSVGELHAFDLSTGIEPAGWPVQLAGPTDIAPVVGTSFLYVVNGPANVSAFPLSPLAPSPAWNATLSEPITGALAVGYGRLFVPTASNLTALVAGSGVLVWNRSFLPTQPGNAVRAVGNSTVFAGSERLYALSASTGDVNWEFEPGTLGTIESSAALLGGTLHLQTSTGATFALGLTPGRPPVAVIASPLPRTYRAREPVTFSSAGTYDPDNQNLSYLWDLGDGNFSALPETTHAYEITGDFRVTLTVTDAQQLASSRAVDIRLIQNQAPALVLFNDRVSPDVTAKNLDDTVWTFRVLYIDADNDPPSSIALNVTNESEPLKVLVPASPGPHDFAAGVNYTWVGTLSSGRHSYSFQASDGLDTAASFPSSLFNIFRIENRSEPPVAYRIQYVGQGISQLRPVTGLISPPGLGPIDRFSITLPLNASLQQWSEIQFFYEIAVNVDDYVEETIAVYWFDWNALQWVAEPSFVDTTNHTVYANITGGSVFVARPEGLTATFGVFGEPTIPPVAPIARITSPGQRTVFSPAESISFSGAASIESNDGNLSNLTFERDFGDGSPLEHTVSAEHAFTTTGNFVVTLKVTNRFGQSHTTTYQVTVRTEASASTFLGIAVAIVAALFAVFVLWPVVRRKSRAPPPEIGGARSPAPGRESSSKGGKRYAPSPSKQKNPTPPDRDDESEVIDEIHDEFERGFDGRQGR